MLLSDIIANFFDDDTGVASIFLGLCSVDCGNTALSLFEGDFSYLPLYGVLKLVVAIAATFFLETSG